MDVKHLVWSLVLIPFLTEAQTTKKCPFGWTEHNQSCYLLHKERSNWFEAEIVCNAHNANLAVVNDSAENTFIKGLIRQASRNVDDANVWFGASDDVIEGTFLWYGKDTPLTFSDWGAGEPSDPADGLEEDCLAYWADHGWQWADIDCHEYCFAICKKSAERDF